MVKKREEIWAVVCEEAGVCGAFVSWREAKEWGEEIKDCPAKHKIKRARITLIKPTKKN